MRNVNKSRKANGQPDLEMNELFPTNFFELNQWRRIVDQLKDKLKSEVKEIYSDRVKDTLLPNHARLFLQHFNRIGRRGLLKLKYEIEEIPENERTEFDQKVLESLVEYKNTDYNKRIAIHNTEKHLANKRKKVYENIALWLKNNYSYLIWNSDLSLQKVAEKASKISLKSDEVAIKKGNKFRQFAGL